MSTNDESSIGEAPDDSDYQVPPRNAIVGGGGEARKTRNSVPQGLS